MMVNVEIQVKKTVSLVELLKSELKPAKHTNDIIDADFVTEILYDTSTLKFSCHTYSYPKTSDLTIRVGAVYFLQHSDDLAYIVKTLNDNYITYSELTKCFKELGWL